MEFSFTLAQEIDPIAIYAAIVSSIVLCWDIIKWRRERVPKIVFKASPNMQFFGTGTMKEDTTYIMFKVTNQGSLSTTITNISGHWYPNYLALIRNKARTSFILPNPLTNQTIPYTLTTGKEWFGAAEQKKLLAEYNTGYIKFEASHSLSEKPLTWIINTEKALEKDA